VIAATRFDVRSSLDKPSAEPVGAGAEIDLRPAAGVESLG
jgi:hypothetical protein